MIAAVYAITHVDSGKMYVGSARNVRVRMGSHRYQLKKGTHSNSHLQNAWVKFGRDAFTFRILLVCSSADLLFYEQLIVDAWHLCDKDHGYNKRIVVSSNAGIPTSLKQKAAMSAMMRDPLRSANVRAMARETARRPEEKARWRAVVQGVKNNPATELKRKIAAAAANSARCKGVPLSQEHRSKLSAAAYKRWARNKGGAPGPSI